jgi:hypothetical protein
VVASLEAVVEAEVEGTVLEVVVAFFDAAEGEGVVETDSGTIDGLPDEADAAGGEEVLLSGGFGVPGCAEVDEGGELEGGGAVFVAGNGGAVFEGEAEAVIADAGVLSIATDGLAAADEELLGGGKAVGRELEVELGDEEVAVAEALGALHLAEPTEEAVVGFGGSGRVGAVEAEVELRSEVPGALEVAGEVVLVEFEGAGAIGGVEEIGACDVAFAI